LGLGRGDAGAVPRGSLRGTQGVSGTDGPNASRCQPSSRSAFAYTRAGRYCGYCQDQQGHGICDGRRGRGAGKKRRKKKSRQAAWRVVLSPECMCVHVCVKEDRKGLCKSIKEETNGSCNDEQKRDEMKKNASSKRDLRSLGGKRTAFFKSFIPSPFSFFFFFFFFFFYYYYFYIFFFFFFSVDWLAT